MLTALAQDYVRSLTDGQHTVELVFDDNGVVSSGTVTFAVRRPAADVDNTASAPVPAETEAAAVAISTGSPRTGDSRMQGYTLRQQYWPWRFWCCVVPGDTKSKTEGTMTKPV